MLFCLLLDEAYVGMCVCLWQPLVDAQSYGSAEMCHLLKQYGGATSEVSENILQSAAFHALLRITYLVV